MRGLLHAQFHLPSRSGAAFQAASTAAALAVGAAALPLLPGPGAGADLSVLRSREPATVYAAAAHPAHAQPPAMLVFVSAYVGASPEMLDWLEAERERLGLSALRRTGPELPLHVRETEATAPFLAELEHQRQELGESSIVREAGG